MGKHRNPEQEILFVEFMEAHQDIARGYVKGDRVAVEAIWAELTEKLNSSGPPTKDCNGWKKTWSDWKVYVKKKLCHNHKENKKTGGGQYNKYVLNDVEESVARVSGIHRSVDGVVGSRGFGEMSDKENDDGELPSTSRNAKPRESDTESSGESCRNSRISLKRQRSRTETPNRAPRTPRTPQKADVTDLLVEENRHLKRIANQMDRLCNMFENHHNNIEKKMDKRNELKLKMVEIEYLKLELEKQKAKLN